MATMARMTTERFFGGVDDRLEYIASTLEFVSRNSPSHGALVEWIKTNTPAETTDTIERNLSFLTAIDLLETHDGTFSATNKGEAFWRQQEPLVMYEGLATAVDGFRTIARSIPTGARTIPEIQSQLQAAYPEYELPEEVVTKHLDWLRSLGLVTHENDTYRIPIEDGTFEPGTTYSRWFIHDVFKGERYKGIATPTAHPLIFIFTGDSGEEYGYEDTFTDDGAFWYTGEGTTGDMTMDGGNRAIREHKSNGDVIHLFEDTDLPWIVQYVGPVEYVDHETREMEDENGELRTGIRFRLEPTDAEELTLTDTLSGSLSNETVFERATTKASEGLAEPTQQTTTSYRYPGSAAVRRYALRVADGVCQGCQAEAPFVDSDGEPYLEVHHIEPRSSGGADAPHNVIAICPNCHRRVHNGQDGSEYNSQLKERAAELYQRFEED